MRLRVPQQARLLQGLLGLMLLVVAVWGDPVKESQSPGAQPGIPLQKEQGDTEMGEQQSPDPGDSVADVSSGMDTCEKWVSCNSHFYSKYLEFLKNDLPSCPCTYPREALDAPVSLLDQRLGQVFYWKDTKGTEELAHGQQPLAGLCLRSVLQETRHTPASQLCCYDSRGRLLTRGKWAGSPELISPDYSPELHHIVDHAPWDFCKRNWTVFQQLLPPDNGLNCPQRPSRNKFKLQ